jgi:hypothetical protein
MLNATIPAIIGTILAMSVVIESLFKKSGSAGVGLDGPLPSDGEEAPLWL